MAREQAPMNLRPSDVGGEDRRTVLKANRPYTREEMRNLSRSAQPARDRARQMDRVTEEAESGQDERPKAEAREIRNHREQPESRQPSRQQREDPVDDLDEAAGRDEPTDDSAEDGSDDAPIETLSGLLEALEISEDDFKSLLVERKVNGEVEQVPYSAILEGTQSAKANTQKAQKLAAAERKFEAEQTQQLEQLRLIFAEARQRTQAAAHVLQAELQHPDVVRLRSDDPAGYLQYQEQAQHRQRELEATYQQIAQQEMKVFNDHKIERMRAGMNRLREVVPDIDTDDRKKKIVEVFAKFGGDEQLVNDVTDERVLWLASAFADATAELAELKKLRTEEAAEARKLVEKSKRKAKRKPSSESGKGISKKRVDQMRANISGQRSRHKRTRALADAISEVTRR